METETKDILHEARHHLATLPGFIRIRYSSDLIEQLCDEVSRLRGIVHTYATVCQSSEREIRELKQELASGRIVHVKHLVED